MLREKTRVFTQALCTADMDGVVQRERRFVWLWPLAAEVGSSVIEGASAVLKNFIRDFHVRISLSILQRLKKIRAFFFQGFIVCSNFPKKIGKLFFSIPLESDRALFSARCIPA